MAILSIKTKKELISFQNQKKYLLIYGSKDCPACRKAKILVEKLLKHYIVSVGFVDVDKVKSNVSSIPVFKAYVDDIKIKSFVGADERRIKSIMKELS